MTDTLATIASPPTPADPVASLRNLPGELGPSAAPAAAPATAPKPAPVAEHAQTYEQRRHAQDQATAKPASEAPVDPQAPAPGEKFKVGKFEVSEDQLAGMMDRQAHEDLRKATMPATPDDYKLELSPGAKLPGEVEYKFNAGDPSLAALKNWAHAKGFDQSTLSEMLTIYATHEATQNAAIAARAREEVAKAGVNAPQRVDAVGKWITGEMGEADAAPIRATIVTDAHLRFYEKMMQKVSSQGTASFSQSHRTAPDTNPIPGYESMTFEQRRYAQDQLAARRR
jgi:hypothetical protein